MCGAAAAKPSLEGIDLAKESIISGVVLHEDEPIGGAYVRLLDRTGEFAAEVPTSAAGEFRFFAAPGAWTLRALAPKLAPVDHCVVASRGHAAQVRINL